MLLKTGKKENAIRLKDNTKWAYTCQLKIKNQKETFQLLLGALLLLLLLLKHQIYPWLTSEPISIDNFL